MRLSGHSCASTVVQPVPATCVALLGVDYPGVIPALQVAVGDRVCVGDTVFTDRDNTRLKVRSPVQGRIQAIETGERRMLRRMVISVDSHSVMATELALPAKTPDRAEVVEHLLNSGLWAAMRARPFNRIPDPGVRPRWVFINAMDTNPGAPDPVGIIDANREAFLHGITCLGHLAESTTFVCCAKELNIDLDGSADMVAATFSGPHPAGLSGTHIHHLADVGIGREAWSMGYQDVIAVGHLFLEGRLTNERVVSIAGDGCARDKLYLTTLGAKCTDLAATLDQAPSPDKVRFSTGSPFAVTDATVQDDYLGRFDLQLNLLSVEHVSLVSLAAELHSPLTWVARREQSLSRFSRSARSQSGMIATETFERVWPFAVPPVPLLRALLSGDAETAETLGCLELAGEDLALCTQVCVGRKNYAEALQRTLDTIREQIQ